MVTPPHYYSGEKKTTPFRLQVSGFRIPDSGFTLIQLAIALVIIGLLTAVIISGNSLKGAAQINSLERTIKEYSQATDDFSRIYGALPGDMANASSFFNCTSCNGNGNGTLESANSDGVNETALYWQHLRLAKLIGGEVKTISGVNYPKAPTGNSVFRVAQNDGGIYYELTSYQGTTAGYSAMTILDVKKLDEKYDDGNPTTGIIKATNGSGATCLSGSSYAAPSSTSAQACVVTIAMATKGLNANESSTLTQTVSACSSSNIGDTRTSTTSCPAGFNGIVVETCGRSGWRVTQKTCEPVSCGGGYYSDTRVLSCPKGHSGSITQTCNAQGGWEITTDTCAAGGSCDSGDAMTLACPYGYGGKKIMRCSGGTWMQDDSTSCALTTCTSGATTVYVGQTITSNSCPAGFDPSGTVTQICSVSGNLITTSSKCIPLNTESCTPPGHTTRNLTCPTGMTGSVSQECRNISGSNLWITTGNTCAAIACGDKPIGFSRESTTLCPSGYAGYIMETCKANGKWELESSALCPRITCPGESALTSFNATFADTNAGSSATGTCNTGYSASPSSPVLACNSDGTWATSLTSGGCTGGTCSSFDYTSLSAGGELQANTTTYLTQYQASITKLSNGNMLIVWSSLGQDDPGNSGAGGIYGQFINSSGLKVGSEFLINTTTSGSQLKPAAAQLTNGNIMITWYANSAGGDGDGNGVMATVINTSGVKVVSDFIVNTTTANHQKNPSIAALSGGNAVIVWWDTNGDGGGDGVYGQLITAAGAKSGGAFLVNTTTSGAQNKPKVAAAGDGGFVVSWQSNGQDGDAWGIYAQRFNSGAAQVGSEFQVNVSTANNQKDPSIAILDNGYWVIAWRTLIGGGNYDAYARIYNSSGTAVTSEFRVNSYTTGDQGAHSTEDSVSVAELAGGYALITWASENQDGSSYGMYGQIINISGFNIGSEFRLNVTTGNDQNIEDFARGAAQLTDGNIVAIWASLTQDGSNNGVYARLFTPACLY